MADHRHLVRLLGANAFFASLGAEAVEAIAALCVTRSLDAGEALFLKGDPGDALYALRRGRIRIVTSTEAGRRLTLNILGSGDVFGEIALLDGRPRTADAIAIEPCEFLMVRRRDFIALLERRPSVAIGVIELLCARLRWVSDRMEESAFLPMPVRLARRLLGLTEDYGSEINVSQEELAVFVGTSRESVNRQLQDWKQKGLVELGRSRIRLVDREGLMPLVQHEAA
ncbi:MAG TPA: Crp/Fnr family transcriptional regulator [Beijerinckiaceae bacterium]|jgi:CRP-like cAMP-binding protein